MKEMPLAPLDRALLALALGLSFGIFAYQVARIIRLIRAGRADDRLDRLGTRLRYALWYVLGQSRVFRNRLTGAAHLVLFYGFLIIGLSTLDVVWQILVGQSVLPVLTESRPFLWLLDATAGLVIVAVLASAYRRYVLHPPEVDNSFGAILVLATIFLLMVTLLIAEATAHVLRPSADAPLLGASLAAVMAGLDRSWLSSLNAAAWWLHLLLVGGFLVYIPYSKHMHLIVCPFNELLRSLRPKGELATANVDSASPLGAGRFDQFTWKHLVDLFACTECGRCVQYCPARLSGRPLSPRGMIVDLRHGLLHQNAGATKAGAGPVGNAVAQAIGREAIWSCTTCRACQEHCPVFVEHVDKIVDARRFLLDTEGPSPTLGKALESLALLGNPQMQPPSERPAFLDQLSVPLVTPSSSHEIVLWLGCAAAYTPTAQQSTSALVKLLKAARVDFAILGAAERCCGDPARRAGEESLFQELAKHNIEYLAGIGVNQLLASCPHCYNTLKNEYPRFGGTFNVRHHVDYIRELVSTQRIVLSRPFDLTMTYHDPCYLGRYNDSYDAPRELLRLATTAGLRELPRARERALCCGGGGGQMYLESDSGIRVNRLRFAEASALAVPVLATACPFCKIMMDDAAQYETTGPKMRVKDIAELVYEAMAV